MIWVIELFYRIETILTLLNRPISGDTIHLHRQRLDLRDGDEHSMHDIKSQQAGTD